MSDPTTQDWMEQFHQPDIFTKLARKLKASSDALEAAVRAFKPPSHLTEESIMTEKHTRPVAGTEPPKKLNPGLQTLIDQINKTIGVEQSVITFIQGMPAQIQAAIDGAMANGASAGQLQPVLDLGTQLAAGADQILAAIAANPPVPAPQ